MEYFIIKTDTTFISENFIHKLMGIIILVFLLKIMNYKFKDIGFKRNKWFKYLIYGLILGGICFGISYFIEYIILYVKSRNPSLELYVNGFSLVGNEVKHTEIVFFILCILLNIVNVIMEEGLFRGFFLKVINNKNSFLKSNMIVALLFGLWHFVMPLRLFITGEMNFIFFIVMMLGYIVLAGIMSIKWGMLYKMTGSLFIGIGDHLFNNIIATNMLHIVSNTGVDELQIVRILIVQIISFMLICLIYKKRKE
jgi:membrane protease YdiL (CAAX protease family)